MTIPRTRGSKRELAFARHLWDDLPEGIRLLRVTRQQDSYLSL